MARIINLLIVILEIIAFAKVRKQRNLKESFVYYTLLSNCVTLITSSLLVFLGLKPFVEVLRLLSASMLAMTFFVSVCILVPMSGKVKEILFDGNGFLHHLLIPVLSVSSYIFAENKVSMVWIVLPIAVTLIYGLVMVYLNEQGKVDGPYPFFQVRRNGAKKTVIWMAALLLVVSCLSGAVGYRKPLKSDMKYIFVHGLSGWGSYDIADEFIPYWGLSGGSIIRYLNNQGYDSYAASVDPTGSAWDRACELYAQLTGTRVDYGEAHSQAAGHERYGEDFTGRALLKDFDSSKFTLIGHSFGGATVRVFTELLMNGSEEERAATKEDDLSPFFKGGNGENLVAVVTLAAPTNGTTAYDMYEDSSFDFSAIEIPEEYAKNSGRVSKATKPAASEKASWDYASYDMHIDNAQALNEKLHTFNDVYYFAYPSSSSVINEDGEVTPDPSITENMFMQGAIYMSKYTGYTKGGMEIGKDWQANDGLVNEISSGAPFNAPQEIYSEETILVPGRWYVMPTIKGDHMSMLGGFTKRVNVKPFYLELVEMLAKLN